MFRLLRRLFVAGIVFFLVALGGFVFVLSRAPVPAAAVAEESTVLYASDGSMLASLAGREDRVSVPLKAVPVVVRQAVVATEDRHFYEHSGLDPAGLLRATVHDLRGGRLEGGSTITQQYVKNAYVGRDRTLWRKLKEAAIAVKIERTYTKDQLLERYLNTVYFGRGAYGVQAAAQAWFGKDVSVLGLREAAYLAGLIRAPQLADVVPNPDTAERRRHLTLLSMERTKYISDTDIAEVEAQPLTSYVVAKRPAGPHVVGFERGAEYVVDEIQRQLVRDYGSARVFGGGLRVKTTINAAAQHDAYEALYGTLNKAGDPSAALVAVDTQGRVRALGGGRDFVTSRVNLALGRAGGGVGRQAGSTFKPLLLAEIAREGYTLRSTFAGPAELVLSKADAGKDWRVRNYDAKAFGNAVDLVDATAQSVNTVYAQAEVAIGATHLVDAARDLGVTAPLRPNASLVLGTADVSVLDMASAYSTLARRGERITPRFIDHVEDGNGTVLYDAKPQPTRVLTLQQADAVNTALAAVVERGTGTAARLAHAPTHSIIGKTGTTQEHSDAWFVGSTTELTAAIWIGYPDGTKTLEHFRGAGPVTGGTIPAAIWKRFMTTTANAAKLKPFSTVTTFPGKRLEVRR
jgi:penicillin-binding protein 1A